MLIPSADDLEYQDRTITKVEPSDGGVTITDSDGWSLWLSNPGFTPEIGQTARFYGRGIGYLVRGVVIAGRVAYYKTRDEQEAENAEKSRLYQIELAARRSETKIPSVVTQGFEWTEDMREISGFGGDYERACRQMISQGCAWWSNHPDADPKFRGFENVMGICTEDNDDAKALSTAINGDIGPSGAMHQAAVSHVFHWRRLGSWIAYQNDMRQLARAETES